MKAVADAPEMSRMAVAVVYTSYMKGIAYGIEGLGLGLVRDKGGGNGLGGGKM